LCRLAANRLDLSELDVHVEGDRSILDGVLVAATPVRRRLRILAAHQADPSPPLPEPSTGVVPPPLDNFPANVVGIPTLPCFRVVE